MRRTATVATVALAAVSVAACRPGGKKVQVAARATIADSADQVMYGIRTLLTDRGVLRAELMSDTAYVFDDNTRFELRGVHTTFYRTTGAKDAVLTSREGTFRSNANSMEARKDVIVTSEDGRTLATAELRFDQALNEIAGDSAFVLTETGRRLEGVGFRSDPDMNNVRVLRGARGDAGQVAVPTGNAAAGRPAGISPDPGPPRSALVRPPAGVPAALPTGAPAVTPPVTPAAKAPAGNAAQSTPAAAAVPPSRSAPPGSPVVP